MGKHGLIKKTGIEPQNDTLIRSCFRQSLILLMQRFKNAVPIQTARGSLLQKQRTSPESIFTRPTRLPWAIIENVAPDEHLPRQTGLCQIPACDIAARDMKCLAHFSFPTRNLPVSEGRNHVPAAEAIGSHQRCTSPSFESIFFFPEYFYCFFICISINSNHVFPQRVISSQKFVLGFE